MQQKAHACTIITQFILQFLLPDDDDEGIVQQKFYAYIIDLYRLLSHMALK